MNEAGAAGRHGHRRRRQRRPATCSSSGTRPAAATATSSSATRAWATSCRPALGVRLAQPEGEVVAFIGDGTYLMNPTELVTALQEGLKITVVISENHGFQCIRRLQMARAGRSVRQRVPRARRERAGSRASTSQLDLARSRRGPGRDARGAPTTAAEVRAALAEARAEPTGPCVIVVRDRAAPLPARLRRLVGRRAAGGLGRRGRAAPCAPSTRPTGRASSATTREPLKARLAAGETVVGTFGNLGSALAVEAMCLGGLDWVLIDLEHGGGSRVRARRPAARRRGRPGRRARARREPGATRAPAACSTRAPTA